MKHKRYILLPLCLLTFALPQQVLASKTHVVRKSESLHTIAHKYHVPVSELKSVNNLSGTRLAKGMRLIIPSDVSNRSKRRGAEKARTYRVAKGDTLSGIARKTGVSVAALRRLNGLRGSKIKPGRKLVLNTPRSQADPAPAVAEATADRLRMVNKDLLSEQEFNSTLAELTDIDSDRPVNLAKNLEDSTSVSKIKKTAYSFLGARYRFGGNSRNALDCSSFTQQVFRDHNIRIPRTAREQFNVGMVVPRGDLRKGDLVFFQTYARFPSHVGIYLGNRKMIHASSRDRRVVISSMDTPYYLSRFLGARRIVVGESSNFDQFDELLVGVEEERDNDVVSNDTLGLSSLSMNN